MNGPLHDIGSALTSRNRLSWLLFAAAAGAVNATAFLACQRFVTHVTGTVTRIGLDTGAWALMAEYLVVLLCFVAGAGTSVLVVRWTRPRWGFAAPLFVAVALLLAVATLGSSGFFGAFGGDIETLRSFVFLSLLSLAMGLQNASVASATALSLRTTHMTGPASDLGVHLATAIASRGSDRATALRLAGIRGGKLVAFIAGAALAVALADALAYGAFLVPALMLSVATLRSLTHKEGARAHDHRPQLGHPGARAAA